MQRLSYGSDSVMALTRVAEYLTNALLTAVSVVPDILAFVANVAMIAFAIASVTLLASVIVQSERTRRMKRFMRKQQEIQARVESFVAPARMLPHNRISLRFPMSFF